MRIVYTNKVKFKQQKKSRLLGLSNLDKVKKTRVSSASVQRFARNFY